MNFSRKHLIPGLIGNLAIIIAGIIGFVLIFNEHPNDLSLLLYFTFISNVLVLLFSLVGVVLYLVSFIKEKNYVCEVFQILKLISVAMVAITFTMVIIFLYPTDPSFGWFVGSQLFMHAVVPLASIFSFVFLEYPTKLRFRFFWTPIIAVILYGAFYIIFAFNAPEGTFVDWYGFMFANQKSFAPVDSANFTVGPFLLFLAESLGGALVFGFVLWLINKIANLILIGYTMDEKEIEEEAVKEEEPVEPVKEDVQQTSKPKATASKAKAKAPNKKYKDGTRTYHISRSKFVSRSWQVKLAGGEKAIKIFPTQAEAIAYAKELVKTQGGSIRIHSMKGQLRK